jgi:hypothetical protein
MDTSNEAELPVVRKRLSTLRPCPENAALYRSINPNDPEIIGMARRIAKRGLQDSLLVTKDNYIISGHRRYVALKIAEQVMVPCRVLDKRYDKMTTDEVLALLRDYNRHRYKNAAEQVREELIDIKPEEAHRQLRKGRGDYLTKMMEEDAPLPITIEGSKRRYGISEDKAEHVRLVTRIIMVDRRRFWPLSVRGVHYPLLNFDFVRGYYWPRSHEDDHGTRRALRYVNDDGSYAATSDLLTRLRLAGAIPWEALDDGTRPVKTFKAFQDVRHFVRQEVGNLFCGYWRNLLQSQPNHIEVICEKNTVYHIALQVTQQYQIPTSSARGFNSIDPYYDLVKRFRASGKTDLVVIILSDYDPEGEQIPHVAGRTLRDDFGLKSPRLHILKAGITRDQIAEHNLPPMCFAKESSSNHAWFVDRNNGDDTVWELEAMDPAILMEDLDLVVRSALDIDLFNREVEREREDAAYLEACHRTAFEALKGIMDA